MTPRREWGGPDRGVLRGERDPGFLQGQPAGLFPGPPALRVPLGGVTMRAALMSIKPEWWEKILAGEKTMEIRKTAPQGGAGEPDPWPMLVLVYVSGTGRGAGEIPLSRIRKNQPAGRTAKAGLHTDGDLVDYAGGPGKSVCAWIVGKPGKIRRTKTAGGVWADTPAHVMAVHRDTRNGGIRHERIPAGGRGP